MTDLPFLRSYEDWKHCITQACGIPLTAAYIETRLAALDNPNDYGTQRFIQTWGEPHLLRVRGWFDEARAELIRTERA